MAVIGFDDVEASGDQELTTIRQPIEEMGKLAFDMAVRESMNPGRSRTKDNESGAGGKENGLKTGGTEGRMVRGTEGTPDDCAGLNPAAV